jgi:TonB family protein
VKKFYLFLIPIYFLYFNCVKDKQNPFNPEINYAPYMIGDTLRCPNPNIDIPFVSEPIIIKRIEPVYPELARRSNIEGLVVVRILVSKQGNVRGAIIMKTDNDIFNRSVLESVIQWEFSPAMSKNGPIELWLVIHCKFTLG